MAINLVESGFEPEIFKRAFKEGWQNYSLGGIGMGLDKIEESSDEEEASKEESKD